MDERKDYIEIDLLEILSLLKSHLAIILTVTILFAAAGFAVTEFLITPQYEASVNMIVNTRTDTTTTVSNDTINSAKNLVDTYAIIIKGNTVLNQVINNLGLEDDYDELEGRITVEAIDDTQVMKITVQDPNPKVASRIVSEITKLAPSEIVDAVEAGSCKVISQIQLSDGPVSPSYTKNVAIAGLIGFVLVAGIIILKHLLSNNIENEDDIQKKLGLTVLGVIPEVTEGK